MLVAHRIGEDRTGSSCLGQGAGRTVDFGGSWFNEVLVLQAVNGTVMSDLRVWVLELQVHRFLAFHKIKSFMNA